MRRGGQRPGPVGAGPGPDLLTRLKRERGLSYLSISHDLSVVFHLSDHIVVLSVGRIVEQGPARQIAEAPATRTPGR
ncbi:hypothetical protein RVR_7358 [Actinacidiphila reveromycinica]|uniref:Uncharacterized protein n=1 Tax=Actinacidiphila reveromycinica TaxID=659352 RepID=A0A7U3VR52_9ACTN|nr:hypothetical protein [Streptomyces sp. SN-593]BBB00340.1 hypothetical protein RVR_7358 [Streptomyces sp. SN-593]